MHSYQQELPFCLKIELTEGCSLRCSFCGINSIRGKKNEYRFMSVPTAETIAHQVSALGWGSRIEMGMRGEPSLNPHIVDIMHVLRRNLPKAYMLLISNGAGFLKDPVSQLQQLFTAGLNTIIIDEYDSVPWSQTIQTAVATGVQNVKIYHYPDDGPEANPHQRQRSSRLVFIPPINHNTHGTHSLLFNHGACGLPPNDDAQGKRCSRPFREMTFRHDGWVPLCCSDWRGVYPIGHLSEFTVEQLWHHPRMDTARRYLYHGIRAFRPCAGCDCTGFRLGLLPDKLGKETLPQPTKKDSQILQETASQGPLTEPVKRPWER